LIAKDIVPAAKIEATKSLSQEILIPMENTVPVISTDELQRQIELQSSRSIEDLHIKHELVPVKSEQILVSVGGEQKLANEIVQADIDLMTEQEYDTYIKTIGESENGDDFDF
jgi:hypothetical protein